MYHMTLPDFMALYGALKPPETAETAGMGKSPLAH